MAIQEIQCQVVKGRGVIPSRDVDTLLGNAWVLVDNQGGILGLQDITQKVLVPVFVDKEDALHYRSSQALDHEAVPFSVDNLAVVLKGRDSFMIGVCLIKDGTHMTCLDASYELQKYLERKTAGN